MGGQPTQDRSQGEADHAYDEQPAASEQVAQPPAGNQQNTKSQLIAGHDETYLCKARAQPSLHTGDSHIDHEQVKDGDKASQ